MSVDLSIGDTRLQEKEDGGHISFHDAKNNAKILEVRSHPAPTGRGKKQLNYVYSEPGEPGESAKLSTDGPDANIDVSILGKGTGKALFPNGVEFPSGITTDTIDEYSADAGVTIDSVLVKDNGVTANNFTANTDVLTDTINEKTDAAGVTIDSVLVKDNGVTANNFTANTDVLTDTINEKSMNAGVTIDSVLLKDDEITVGAIKVEEINCNSIDEDLTLLDGVTVEGVRFKTGVAETDTINEKTPGSGVTVDGLLIKDGAITIKQWRITDQKAQNTNGGDFNNGAWRVRDLNTMVDNHGTGGISLAANTITISADGKYTICGSAPAHEVDMHQTRVMCDGVNIGTGTSEHSDNDVSDRYQTRSFFKAFCTVSGTPKNVTIEHRADATQAGNGFGVAGNFGPEVYTIVDIVRSG